MTSAVIYTSKTGGTKKVANYIASKIGAEAIQLTDGIDPSKYEKVILGSGVYAGKISKAMMTFIDANRDRLKDASLFVCCMFDGDKGAKQLEKISETTGIADAIFFTKPKAQMEKADSKLNEYIKTL